MYYQIYYEIFPYPPTKTEPIKNTGKSTNYSDYFMVIYYL